MLVAVTPVAALLLVAPMGWVSVGGQDRLTQPASPGPAAPVVAVEDLQASVEADVVVKGDGDTATLEVTADPTPVWLGEGRAAVELVFSALRDEEASFAPFPYWSAEVPSDDDGTALGLAGFCGTGWGPTGVRLTDRCSAVRAVSGVEPGEPAAVSMDLYPRVGDRQAAPGTYRTQLELQGGQLLRFVITVTERTATTSPPSPSPATEPTAAAAGTQTVQVFFVDTTNDLDCGAVQPVIRQVAATDAVATAALTELFGGATEQEQSEGLGGFGPETAALLRSVRVMDGTAYVDLDASLLPGNFGTSCGGSAFGAMVGSTLTQFPTVDNYVVALDGDPRAFVEFMQGACPQPSPAPGDSCDPATFQSPLSP